jgi:transposase-like protein
MTLLFQNTEALALRPDSIAAMTDDEARKCFAAIRWHESGGEPICPKCAGADHYILNYRQQWKCKSCNMHFSVTSGTIFSGHKLPIRKLLLAIAAIVSNPKTFTALGMSRELGVQYKVAYVLASKIKAEMQRDGNPDQYRGYWQRRRRDAA